MSGRGSLFLADPVLFAPTVRRGSRERTAYTVGSRPTAWFVVRAWRPRRQGCDRLAFNPSHTLAEDQPRLTFSCLFVLSLLDLLLPLLLARLPPPLTGTYRSRRTRARRTSLTAGATASAREAGCVRSTTTATTRRPSTSPASQTSPTSTSSSTRGTATADSTRTGSPPTLQAGAGSAPPCTNRRPWRSWSSRQTGARGVTTRRTEEAIRRQTCVAHCKDVGLFDCFPCSLNVLL